MMEKSKVSQRYARGNLSVLRVRPGGWVRVVPVGYGGGELCEVKQCNWH